MKTTLTLGVAALAATFVLGSTAFAGPGGREPDLRIAPREYSITGTMPMGYGYARTGTTIGLAVVTTEDEQRELTLVRRFNAQGKPFYLYVPRWMAQE